MNRFVHVITLTALVSGCRSEPERANASVTQSVDVVELSAIDARARLADGTLTSRSHRPTWIALPRSTTRDPGSMR
jgi:hypothetical protein